MRVRHNACALRIVYPMPLLTLFFNVSPLLSCPQEKACKQEDRLIAKLQELDMDTNLVGVLRRQAIVLLDGGPTSGLGLGVHRDSIPMHTFSRFLFVALLDYYPDLAYEVGLRAMRFVYLNIYRILQDLCAYAQFCAYSMQ